MIVSIHQPSYFPWLGWLHKVKQSDVFILMDEVQLSDSAYQHRNIFLDKEGNEKYLNIGIRKKGYKDLPMKDIEILKDVAWQQTHKGFLETNYSAHPHFREVMAEVGHIFTTPYETLGEVLDDVVLTTLRLMGVETKVIRQSEMDYDRAAKKGDLVLTLVEGAGGSVYLSGQGAKAYMDDDSFRQKGIDVQYQQFSHPYYTQKNTGRNPETFKKGIATLDLLFNEGAEESARLLESIK